MPPSSLVSPSSGTDKGPWLKSWLKPALEHSTKPPGERSRSWRPNIVYLWLLYLLPRHQSVIAIDPRSYRGPSVRLRRTSSGPRLHLRRKHGTAVLTKRGHFYLSDPVPLLPFTLAPERTSCCFTARNPATPASKTPLLKTGFDTDSVPVLVDIGASRCMTKCHRGFYPWHPSSREHRYRRSGKRQGSIRGNPPLPARREWRRNSFLLCAQFSPRT